MIRHSGFVIRHSRKLPLRLQRLPQLRQILPRRYVDGPERPQVGRGRLRVEQFELAFAQALHEVDERDFAGVALAVEHALAEERGAEADAVEAAGELAVAPGLDAVGVAEVVEADDTGVALILTTHKERAELYQEQFTSKGLVVTIEPAE